ncbi:hypothetical protein M422DRAFT_172322, partial [Sphaerobolus stellatus SS14]
AASDFELDDQRIQKSKYKPAGEPEKKKSFVKKPTGTKSAATGSQSLMLTAAEQRALEKNDKQNKQNKQNKEDFFSFLVDVRDKDKNRPGDSNYDSRTLYIPPSAWKNFTPIEKQFWEIKQNYFDTVIFFQKEKFIELYEDDARIGNRVFDLKLTSRVKMVMVRFSPFDYLSSAHFFNVLRKFLAKGYKVAHVAQAETALGAEMRRTADKGAKSSNGNDTIVRRELNKIYTNGTLVDADLLMDDEAGHCVSIREDEENNTFGICILDSATSQFDLSSFVDDVCRTKLETVMRQLRPKEIIFTKGNLSVTTTRLFRNVLDSSCLWNSLRPSEGFKYDEAVYQLKEMFHDDDDAMEEGQGLPEAIREMLGHKETIEALGGMIWYVQPWDGVTYAMTDHLIGNVLIVIQTLISDISILCISQEIYQVETSANQKDIPKDWKKTGSNKAVKRWSVPALAGNIRKLQEARERRNTVIKEYKYRIYGEFDVDRAIWLRVVKVVAELDCLFSLAKSSMALGEPACKPTFVESESAFIDFEELRHPALQLKGDFIPNDVRLGDKVGRIMLLTGPNMAGKSTIMRMTAAGVIMAQLGMLVPAKSARLAPADSILTRMGAYDNMFSNSSTFKVELDECCKILRDATPKSLVILDELGRGTSTFDGMAIAEAVLHELATHTLPLSCFATHYSTLTDDFAHHPNIRNMHMQTMVDDEKRELLFLYKLVEGVATGSFGTHVANLAGVPMDVVMRAETISNDFAQKFREKQAEKKQNAIPLLLQADFAFLLKLATGAISADADRYKMAETLKILNKFVKNQAL